MKKFLGAFLILSIIPHMGFSEECFDHSIWEKIITANVNEDGYVDYDGIRINKGGGNFFEYLTYVEIAKLAGCSQSEKTAFWINAYNLNVVRQILDNPGRAIIPRNDGMYKEKEYVANKKVSLSLIRDRVLRLDVEKGGPIKGMSIKKYDPRILFALTDGTLGAPRLSKAFVGETLVPMLQTVTRDFVNDTKNIRIENGKLMMSDLFQIYQKDFDVVGGVVPFLSGLTDAKKRPDKAEIDAKLLADFPDKVIFISNRKSNSLQVKGKK